MVPEISVNFVAVAVAAIAGFAIGMAWYSPALFGRQWEKAAGVGRNSMTKPKYGMAKSLVISLVASVFMAFVLTHSLKYAAGMPTLMDGLTVGFWTWLGFMATAQLNPMLWEGRPVKYYLINVGYQLAQLLAMGLILAYMA